MSEDLYGVLMRYHREEVRPEIDSGNESLRAEMLTRFDEMLTHFDQVYKRFDRLESEHYALSAAVKRLEDRET